MPRSRSSCATSGRRRRERPVAAASGRRGRQRRGGFCAARPAKAWAARGSSIAAQRPPSRRFSRHSRPLWASTMAWTMERPRPKPLAALRLRARSPRTKGWSIASRSASGIPGPESSTQTRTPRSEDSIWTSARPPYFTALSTRLVTARCNSSGRPWTRTCRLRPTLTGAPEIREIVADRLDHRREVHEAVAVRIPSLAVAHEGERRFHEAVHLVEVAQGGGPRVLVLDEFGTKPQAGDRRAQVVADRGEHLRAVVDQPPHPGPHPVERPGHGQHLARTCLRQRDVVVAGAERLRGAGEALQRRREGPGRPDAEQRQGQRQEHHGEDQGTLAGPPQRIVRQRRLEARPGRA